ncbi:MAG: hypothetical protein ACYSOP_03500, partial [Planctomycetota bacterium]
MRKLKTILRANRIKPEWMGDEPDLNKPGGKRSGGRGRRPSGPSRGGKRKNFRGRKPKKD